MERESNQCRVGAPDRGVQCTRVRTHINDPDQMCHNASANLSWCPHCNSYGCVHMVRTEANA